MNLETLATVRLIEGVCLIRCPLNTGLTVGGLLTVYPLHPLIRFSEGLDRARAWGLYRLGVKM